MAVVTKDELKRLQKTLKTDAAIGEKFGVTRQAIHQLRVKYGIESDRNKNKERNEKIVSLYKKGKTGTKIAQELGLSISQVHRVINKKKK